MKVSVQGLTLALLALLLRDPPRVSAAVLRMQPTSEVGPLAVVLVRRPQQHHEPLVMGLDSWGDDIGEALSNSAATPQLQGPVDGDTMFLRTAKRQVRYHQCYFNPISCFG